jgi:uncharacterized membrane-anchored protein
MSGRRWTVLGALLVLLAFNWAWFGKARIVASGAQVFVALAPVDPRSLLQGDFMALRFGLSGEIETARAAAPAPSDPQGAAFEGAFGRAPVQLDARGVASLDWTNPAPALALRYRLRNGQIWLGTNAFFFAEGEVERYRNAQFGMFRVDTDSGEALLVGLTDADLVPL